MQRAIVAAAVVMAIGCWRAAADEVDPPPAEVQTFFERSARLRLGWLKTFEKRLANTSEDLRSVKKGAVDTRLTKDQKKQDQGRDLYRFHSAEAKKTAIGDLATREAELRQAVKALKAGTGWPVPWIDQERGDPDASLEVGRIGRFSRPCPSARVIDENSIAFKLTGERPIILRGIQTGPIADDDLVRLRRTGWFEVVRTESKRSVFGEKTIYFVIEPCEQQKVRRHLKTGDELIEWPADWQP